MKKEQQPIHISYKGDVMYPLHLECHFKLHSTKPLRRKMEESYLFLMIEGIDWELTSEPQQQTTTTTMSLQDKLNFPFVKIHFIF